VPSRWMKAQISQSILQNKLLRVIPNGIDLSVFHRLSDKAQLRQKLGLPLNPRIVIFFSYGRKNLDKGWQYLENVLAHRPDIHFLGIGPSMGRRSNLTSVGSVFEPRKLVEFYNAADALLYPSLAESFGMVPLEASACGLPVVSFPVGIIPELINHKANGYIARYRDGNDLERGVDYVLKNVRKINRPDDRYDIKTVASAFIRLYEKTK
jgi:glycosyltransferase involved in cell wall biosynthesis